MVTFLNFIVQSGAKYSSSHAEYFFQNILNVA